MNSSGSAPSWILPNSPRTAFSPASRPSPSTSLTAGWIPVSMAKVPGCRPPNMLPSNTAWQSKRQPLLHPEICRHLQSIRDRLQRCIPRKPLSDFRSRGFGCAGYLRGSRRAGLVFRLSGPDRTAGRFRLCRGL